MNRRVLQVFLAVALLVGCGGSEPESGITVPEGFEIEVAAGSPLVDRPMIIDTDDQGRLYVAESSGSNAPVEQQLEQRTHSILRLEDVDGDGRYDKRTVFADGMMLPEGVLWHDGSVYVAAPPVIWKLTDEDGDGVADRREEWYDAKTLTGCANDLHGPYLGLDGWIYWTKGAFAEQTYERPGDEPFVTRASHIFRRRPEGGVVEPVLTGGMDNPVEVEFSPEGERFLTATFLQHPQLGRRDGLLHAVYGGVYGKVHGVTDGHPMTGGFLSVMTHMGPAAAVGLERYDSGVFGEDYRGRLFATSFNMHKVTAHRLVPKGSTFETEDSDFFVSPSTDFHPTDVMEDADGSLLVVDTGGWYRLCCPTSQLSNLDAMGSIYRVRRTGAAAPADPWGNQLDWGGMSAGELTGLLDDERPAVRRRAIAAAAKRGAVDELLQTVKSGATTDARRNAVWALTRIEGDAARAAVRTALEDKDRGVRQAALHSVSVRRDAAALDLVLAQLNEGDAPVKRAAAEALGRLGDSSAVPELLAQTADTDEEVLTHSLTYALMEIADPAATRAGLKATSVRTQRAAMIALDQMRRGDLKPETVLPWLSSADPLQLQTAEWIAAHHPEWGGALAGFFARRLQEHREADAKALVGQLSRFSEDSAIQALLARTAGGSGPAQARRTALAVMASAPPKEAPQGWSEAIVRALANRETAAEATEAGRRLPRPEAGNLALDQALLAVARGSQAPTDVRVKALEAGLGGLDGLEPALYDLVAEQVLSDSVEVRGAAAQALSKAPLSQDQLQRLTEVLPEAGPMELPLLVEAYGKSSDPQLGDLWLTKLADAKGLANLRADILEAAVAGYPAPVKEKAAALLAERQMDRKAQREKLEALLASLDKGDPRRGQEIFNSNEAACISCHAIGYEGGRVGPDLSRIGRIRERRDLLEAILYPSASFVRSYEPIIVVTQDDVVNGIAIEQTETHMLLAVSAHDQVRIARDEIEEVRPGTVSVMPSGLDEQLNKQQLADLLAFLETTHLKDQESPR